MNDRAHVSGNHRPLPENHPLKKELTELKKAREERKLYWLALAERLGAEYVMVTALGTSFQKCSYPCFGLANSIVAGGLTPTVVCRSLLQYESEV